jgi:hypothetical protein
MASALFYLDGNQNWRWQWQIGKAMPALGGFGF